MMLLRLFAAAAAIIQTATAHSQQRNPIRYITRVEDVTLPSRRVHSLSSFDMTFRLHDKTELIRLVLEPNHDIIADGAVISLHNADGTVTKVPIERHHHRVFKGQAFVRHDGHAEWLYAGWARVSMHEDGDEPLFEGAFVVDNDHHHIQMSSSYMRSRLPEDPAVELTKGDYMVVWRDSDIIQSEVSDELKKRGLAGSGTCGSDHLDFNANADHPIYRGLDVRDLDDFSEVPNKNLFARQMDGTTGGNGAGVNLAGSIGQTAGCPDTRKVALVGIAADCTYARFFNQRGVNVTQNIITQMNTASQLYETSFNISLAIRDLTILSESCPTDPSNTPTPWNIECSPRTSITDRLSLFSRWRGTFQDGNAFWTLLTTCGTDSAVGLAWLGQVCKPGAGQGNGNNETVAATNVVVQTPTEWQVIAHEVGHTFGAVHDCTSSGCNDGTATRQQCCPLSATSCDARQRFIMNPSTGNGITQFSPCSIGNICSAIGRSSVKTNCLTSNRGIVTITGSRCGNGIVEQGEQCDCGGPDGCRGNTCCDPQTCRFTANSQCDPSNEDCCTPTCQLASSGTVCRASSGACDPEEKCSGTSPLCPADTTAPDGTVCGASGAGLACASGQCTSRDQQCKTLLGSRTTNNDTYACNNNGCRLSCASPQFGRDTCITLPQNFLDGSPCQGGGKCNNGVCPSPSFIGQAEEIWAQNKHIIIPVVAVVGGLIVLSICICIFTSCRKRATRRKIARQAKQAGAHRAAQPPVPPSMSQSRVPPPPPGWGGYGSQSSGAWEPQRPPMSASASGGSGRPSAYGAAYSGYSSPAPNPNAPQGYAWPPHRSSSARYA